MLHTYMVKTEHFKNVIKGPASVTTEGVDDCENVGLLQKFLTEPRVAQ